MLYNGLVIPLLRAGVWVAKWFVPKIREREAALSRGLPACDINPGIERVLFHAPSMGELEQLLPIIEILKQRNPRLYAIVSCTSPSGYKHAVAQNIVNQAVYLPLDARALVREFLNSLRPHFVVIDRYDVWPNFVTLASATCPVILVNATFPSVAKRPLLKPWASVVYSKLNTIVAVTHDDALKLGELTGRIVTVEPDTRIDRVKQRIESVDTSFDNLRCPDKCTLILGSSWQQDEDLIFNAMDDDLTRKIRLIIVPHEPTEQALQRIERRIRCVRLSKLSDQTDGHILVDSVGKLLALYRIADAAFVGGGFGTGVHSTTEPALYGIPVSCGPRIERSRDASALASEQLLFVAKNEHDVRSWIHDVVLNDAERKRILEHSRVYLARQTGASERYAGIIETSLAMYNKHV